MFITHLTKRLALAGAGALALASAAPYAQAQAYGPYNNDYEQYGTETGAVVTVHAPRRQLRDRFSHAPIDIVRETRPVYYGDLDLRSRWGVHELRERVIRTAERLCTDIADTPGNTDEDNPNECIRVAVLDALDRTPISDELRYEISNVDYLTGPRSY